MLPDIAMQQDACAHIGYYTMATTELPALRKMLDVFVMVTREDGDPGHFLNQDYLMHQILRGTHTVERGTVQIISSSGVHRAMTRCRCTSASFRAPWL